MDPAQQRSARAAPGSVPRDERAAAVRTWPGLTAQAKLAHQYLYYVRSRVGSTPIGQPGTVRITFAEIGADQGTTGTSGGRAYDQLRREGLLEQIDARQSVRTVYLPDPLDAAIARRRAHEGDGQGVLFEAQEEPEQDTDELKYSGAEIWHEPSATDPPAETAGAGCPAGGPSLSGLPPGAPGAFGHGSVTDPLRIRNGSVAGLQTSETNLSLETSDFGKKTSGNSIRAVVREVSEVSSHGSVTDPLRVAGVLAELLAGRSPTPAQQAEWIEELVDWIQEQVADPKLHVTPCLRVAEAVVQGEYPARELVRVVRYLHRSVEQRTLRAARWSYFVGAVQQSMREHDSRTK